MQHPCLLDRSRVLTLLGQRPIGDACQSTVPTKAEQDASMGEFCAAPHRINNRQLDDVYRMPASFIPLTSILPGASDMETIRSRMIIVVTRIIASQLLACNHL